MLQRLSAAPHRLGPRAPRTLVLAPTRELAVQIADSFRKYGRNLPLVTTVVFGGVNQERQVRELERGVDVLVATPGRLLDLIGQGKARLDQIEVLVLDEADRMLDMGFINDIRKLVKLVPVRRQTLLFSATMPTEIAKLADSLLTDPLRVNVTPPATTATSVRESVVFLEQPQKRTGLRDLLASRGVERALVFTRTKHGANRVVKQLCEDGIEAEALHGNKSQAARQRALENFRTGAMRVLVATDIAARGIDVTAITHVVNFDLPDDPESYVHRIGRTARAGATGIAITFCSPQEQATLRTIEKLIGHPVPVGSPEEYGLSVGIAAPTQPSSPAQDARRRATSSGRQPREWRPAPMPARREVEAHPAGAHVAAAPSRGRRRHNRRRPQAAARG